MVDWREVSNGSCCIENLDDGIGGILRVLYVEVGDGLTPSICVRCCVLGGRSVELDEGANGVAIAVFLAWLACDNNVTIRVSELTSSCDVEVVCSRVYGCRLRNYSFTRTLL